MKRIITDYMGEYVLASADETSEGDFVECEGSWYFPPEQVDMSKLRISERSSICTYKGTYFWIDLEMPHNRVQNIAWVYRDPKVSYAFLKDRIGFFSHDTAGTRATTE